MASKVGETHVAGDGAKAKPTNTVALSRLSLEALAGKEGADDPARAGAQLANAIRFYLGDRGAGRPAWPYPGFLRGGEVQEDLAITFELDASAWSRFEAEAAEQDVSVQKLAEHAAFYLAAEIDAGRVTQRILDDLAAADGGDPQP